MNKYYIDIDGKVFNDRWVKIGLYSKEELTMYINRGNLNNDVWIMLLNKLMIYSALKGKL